MRSETLVQQRTESYPANMAHTRRSAITLFGAIFVAAAAAGGTGCGGGNASLTNNVGNTTNSGNNGTQTGTNGTPNTGVNTVTARAFAEGNDRTDQSTRVLLSWSPGADIAVTSVVQYLLYRDNALIDAVAANVNQYVDTPDADGTFAYSVPSSVGQIGIPAATNGGGPPSPVLSVSLTQFTGRRAPMPARISHRYRVIAVVLQPGTGLYRMVTIGAEGGAATPIFRPEIAQLGFGPTAPATYTTLQAFVNTSPGADQYVLEFSENADFTNKQSSTIFPAAIDAGSPLLLPDVNLLTLFPGIETRIGTRVYYRVGALNSGDTPGPLSTGSANGGNFVYSAGETSFEIVAVPPPSP